MSRKTFAGKLYKTCVACFYILGLKHTHTTQNLIVEILHDIASRVNRGVKRLIKAIDLTKIDNI